MTARYEDITETTGTPVTPQAAEMLYTRYAIAAEMAKNLRVLELGCGAALGMGMISASAKFAVGGDYSAALLESAKKHYGARIPLVRLSAEDLPFRDDSFDVVFFFEATYYIPNMERAFAEIDRVLDGGGRVLFVNANPERPDFIRSPFSTHYHTAAEFASALQSLGLKVSVEGAFPIAESVPGRRLLTPGLLRALRKTLETLHLVPRTLRGRARIKRLLYGKLTPVPAELKTGYSTVAPRFSVDAANTSRFTVLYVTGRKPN